MMLCAIRILWHRLSMSLGCFQQSGTRNRVLFHFSHKPELRVLSVDCISLMRALFANT